LDIRKRWIHPFFLLPNFADALDGHKKEVNQVFHAVTVSDDAKDSEA